MAVERWTAFVGVVGDEYRLDPRGEWVRFEDHERVVNDLEAELLRLRSVLRQTHVNHCTEAWTGRGLHAPECLLYEVDP